MIICVCREISDNDYSSDEELKNRIMQNDFKCGICQTKYIMNDELLSVQPEAYQKNCCMK